MDTFVQTEGNRAAYRRIAAITQTHDEPERLFLVGPAQSGKTTLVRARQLDKDLLSKKRVLYRPCAELAEAMRANVYDGYLQDLGEHEVLFLDDFEGFYEDEELGPKMCELLMRERARLGLDTVITASKPLASFGLSLFGDALDGFEEVQIEPLDREGMLEFVRGLVDDYTDPDVSPVLSDEALEFIAWEMEDELPEMKRKAMYYLLTQYEGEAGETLSRSFVEQALAR